jgi:16S rRNA processing protein RimM
MESDSLILIGKIAATHGIKGQLRIVSYSGHFDSLLVADSVILKEPSGKTGKFAVSAAVMHGKKLLLTLDGLSDINRVLHLVGSEIYLRLDQLPETDEGEYYWHELIGLKVVTVSGEPLGVLQSIIETGSNDVYVVKAADRELLIPALEDVVTSIDLAAGVMTVTPSPGLFDL